MASNVKRQREDQVSFEFDGSLLFHGTNRENAEAIVKNLPRRPRIELAEDFLADYGITLKEMMEEKEFQENRSYFFRSERDHQLSTADKFELAKSYAMRLPEWQWYTFQMVAIKKFGKDWEQNWVKFTTEHAAKLPNPVVIAIRPPEPVASIPDWIRPLHSGKEYLIEYPLPPSYELVSIIEIDRSKVI
jgi:hypothetical protein